MIDSISSVSQLRNVALGADLDPALFAHMTSAAGRQALAGALLRSCFSGAGQVALGEQGSLHGEAFRYSRVLEEAAHSLPAAEKVFPVDYKAAARDQGFRRAIVLHYDHRCAFCGTRIVIAEGHTVVDAAPSVRQLELRQLTSNSCRSVANVLQVQADIHQPLRFDTGATWSAVCCSSRSRVRTMASCRRCLSSSRGGSAVRYSAT